MHVYACLLLCFMPMFAFLDLGFAMLCALCGLVLVGHWGHLLVWFHSSLLWHVWIWPLMRHISIMFVCLLLTFLYSVRSYDCLACTRDPESHIGILLHGVCVVHTPILWNYGNPIQTYICPLRTPSLFDSMFVCPCLALFASVSLCMLFMPLYYLLCSPVSCFLHLLHVHAWSEDAWSEGMTS